MRALSFDAGWPMVSRIAAQCVGRRVVQLLGLGGGELLPPVRSIIYWGERPVVRNRGSSQRRPSVALVVSLIALFVALGGGATAASKVLFTGADIKNKSVTGKDIKNKTIGRKHLNNRALAMIDSSKTVAGAKGAKGTKGDRGPRGAKGKPWRELLRH